MVALKAGIWAQSWAASTSFTKVNRSVPISRFAAHDTLVRHTCEASSCRGSDADNSAAWDLGHLAEVLAVYGVDQYVDAGARPGGSGWLGILPTDADTAGESWVIGYCICTGYNG